MMAEALQEQEEPHPWNALLMLPTIASSWTAPLAQIATLRRDTPKGAQRKSYA